MTLPSTLAEARVVRIGTLTFRVYNESRDKQHVNIEITADGNDSAGNIDCSLREWHGLQDLANADSLRAALAAAERELERWRHGATIEGDFLCPNALESDRLRALCLEACSIARSWMPCVQIMNDECDEFLEAEQRLAAIAAEVGK